MLLNSDSVVHYLLQRGYLSFESVVNGDLMVVEAHRRNHNFKIIRQNNPGLFVKQVQQWDAQAIATVQREGSCYGLAQNVPELSTLMALLPEFRGYDSARHVLVLELLSGYEPLAEYHVRSNQFPIEIAEVLAKALGTFHHETRGKLEKIPQAKLFPKIMPWALSMHLLQPDWFQSLSAANSQLLEIVKKYDEFATALNELRGQWKHTSLVHGDIKWDNCLIQSTSTLNGKPVMKVVDWELADLGDPLWDAAAILQSYLSHWILSMPVWPGATPDQLIAKAPWPLETLQLPIYAFWKTYCDVTELPAKERKALLKRTIGYAAARMIQSAYESLSFATQINSNALYLLQVSMNILLHPQDAAGELFGIVEA